ncbi:MAG: glycosyltransferase [Planctomycetes bacterium]|nr:glycosyltransferase [Planctomycetota bacterium]
MSVPSPGGNRPLVAVVVATHDRTALLRTRSLPSIVAQRLQPDLLVLADDSSEEASPENEKALRSLALPPDSLVYLGNYRTKGAAGAWNTALDWLHRKHPDPGRVFVAFLDDDDSWEPGHLEDCVAAAAADDLDVVASGLFRVDHQPHEQRPPAALRAEDILVGNPHIQGSNLFARLSVLLEVGNFDENLTNCTDRDLCLRICDLGNVRYGPTTSVTVRHYADRDRPRMSNPATGSLDHGRTQFWLKYEGRMTEAVREASAARAARLFGWEPPPPLPAVRTEVPAAPPFEIPFPLVAAVATNSPARVRPLLEQLCRIGLRATGGGLDVLLLANGDGPLDDELSVMVEEMRTQGLRCYLLSRARQAEDARRGVFGPGFTVPVGAAEIGATRTMLQVYAYDFARRRPGAVVWVLDDDLRPDLADHYLPRLAEFRAQGVHVVLGSYSSAPPLPIASCVRVQLVDLLHNLHWLRGLPPDAPIPDRSGENARHRAKYPDYYYDLSRACTGQLEVPFFVEPAFPGETARQAEARLVASAVRMLAGEQVTRPLPAVLAGDPIQEARESVERGGNTFVLDIEALRDAPNLVPQLGGQETRRSDMIWAVVQRRRFGRRIVRVDFPLRQDRSDLPPAGLGVEKLVPDIEGYALRTALHEVLKEKAIGEGALQFSDAEVARACRRAAKYLEERLAAFSLSFYRIRGLSRALRRLDASGALSPLLDALDRDYTPENLSFVRERVRVLGTGEVSAFLRDLDRRVSEFRGVTVVPEDLELQRVDNARRQVLRMCSPRGDLHLLGCGNEAVVLTDGLTVFKYVDYWKAAGSSAARTFLSGLVGTWRESRSLYPVLAVREEGVHFILEYPFEESEPYVGGHGPGLVALLRECRERGLACRNIHPDNLRVVGERVVLVDYGSDLRPLTDGEFLHMCRRAWLSWRWHHRPDLKALMTKALKDTTLPELDGFERFQEAVKGTDVKERLDSRLAEIALERSPRRVLDVGCGKGDLVTRLREECADAVGFDPDASLAVTAWPKRGQGSALTGDLEIVRARGPFDVVVSELVLCSLHDDDEYRGALGTLRSLVSHDGQILIAVCDPFFTQGGPTSFQERTLPPNAAYEQSFNWTKRVHRGGDRWGTRVDRHRPLERLERDLLRAGLEVLDVEPVPTVDLVRFEPASEFLILKARPVPPVPAQVSLLIKACAMDWESVHEQVPHLVDQLERPHAFAERVVVVDSRTDGFVRQYARPDLPRLLEELEVLREAGVIDRVVRAEGVEALMERWTGRSTVHGHSVKGAPLSAFFAGVEACSGEFVLQVDVDMMVGRDPARSDYLTGMVRLLQEDPRGLTVAMPIPRNSPLPWTSEERWRVEVRACLFHRERLLACRPLPVDYEGDVPTLSWHRALDRLVQDRLWTSYRGGGDGIFAIHPPNDRKKCVDGWLAVLDGIERGQLASSQRDHAELVADPAEWLLPKREEPYVFVVCGRDVPPGRAQRCLDSLLRQEGGDWGVVLMDDGSSARCSRYLCEAARGFGARATRVRVRRRRGLLANLVWAIRHVCVDPETVIITVDLDDCLLGPGVLARVREAYARGAEVTVGSMLRTDKSALYPVDFEDPVRGNVWQHLRTFKKRLFDQVPEALLRPDGEYVDIPNDWAFMLPIVQMAERKEWIRDPLYLHEPSGVGKGRDRERRETEIGCVVERFRAWRAGNAKER